MTSGTMFRCSNHLAKPKTTTPFEGQADPDRQVPRTHRSHQPGQGRLGEEVCDAGDKERLPQWRAKRSTDEAGVVGEHRGVGHLGHPVDSDPVARVTWTVGDDARAMAPRWACRASWRHNPGR